MKNSNDVETAVCWASGTAIKTGDHRLFRGIINQYITTYSVNFADIKEVRQLVVKQLVTAL